MLAGKSYLITVDYFSKCWELDTLTNTSSETTVEHNKVHFARYGIPEKVITDNSEPKPMNSLLLVGDSVM